MPPFFRLFTCGYYPPVRSFLHKLYLCHPERSRRVPFRVGIFAVADSNINGMSGGHPLREPLHKLLFCHSEGFAEESPLVLST